jgi:outer membrane immunogenic protein
MKSLIAMAAVAAVAAIAAPASAQVLQSLPSYAKPITFNASLGYTGITWKQNNLGAVTLRGGADFGKYVGVEGEGSFGVSDATANIATLSAKTHLNNAYAGYFVGRFPIDEKIGLFARVGYGHVDAQQSVSLGALSATAKTGVDSLNYGAGGQYLFDGKNGLRVEYTRYDFRMHNSQAADTWSLGYVRKF